MALYKVLELSFIGNTLRQEGEIVDINDNPKKGGMEPGANLAACDADGNLLKAPKRRADAPAADAAPADAPAADPAPAADLA